MTDETQTLEPAPEDTETVIANFEAWCRNVDDRLERIEKAITPTRWGGR